MRALTVRPGTPDSAALEDVPEPPREEGALLVRALALGVCGTDREIIAGEYGDAPPGRDRLVLGHESLGRVEDAPAGSGFARGDLVVGIVRHPDPAPCPNCAAGEWDMCRTGEYTEHGIKALGGFGAERWRVEPDFAVKLDPSLGILGVLLEPTSVVAKAWEHVERIGERARWTPERVLVTGGGPVGLLGALLGVQRGLEVHVFDRATEGIKVDLTQALGAIYHSGDLDALPSDFDVVLECTAASHVIVQAMGRAATNGIVCLLGVSSEGHDEQVDIGRLNRAEVLGNQVVFGSVNANRRHYEAAAAALAKADRGWLGRLITRRVPLDQWADALQNRKEDIKTVIEFSSADAPAERH
jgi:threonine dehydrogenase-like Zn-dependent dehydrogenase